MARPRKYASEAEAAAAKRMQDRERRRAELAVEHAKKADPTKRKDARVNATDWPLAPVNEDTKAAIELILSEAGELNEGWSGLMTDVRTVRRCAALFKEWEDAHRLRLPPLDEDGAEQVYEYTARTVSGPMRFRYRMTPGQRWNKFRTELRLSAFLFFERGKAKPGQKKRDQAEADAAGITLSQLYDRRESAAAERRRERELAGKRKAHEDAIAFREARASAESLEGHSSFGRF